MMEIIKFRIKNYKSIIDSGDCYIANKVTILAGKNESGKTSILEALEDFDTDKSIRISAFPIRDESHKPEIIITFRMDAELLNKIMEKIEISKNFENDAEITVKKYNLDGVSKYRLDGDSLSIIGFEKEKIQTLYNEIKNKLKILHEIFPTVSPTEFLDNYVTVTLHVGAIMAIV